MLSLKRFLSFIFATSFMLSANAGQMDCRSASYRKTHPITCKDYEPDTNTKTVLGLAGGAAVIGLGVAMFQNSSGDHGKSSEISNQNVILRSSNADVTYSQNDFVKLQD